MINRVQHYQWGSRQGIPALLGIDNPTNVPYAEYWMGAHPAAPSRLQGLDKGTDKRLDALIAANPQYYLGRRVLGQFGATLPFLFKLLSVEKALSIQAHPTLAQAQRGFAAENERGIAITAANRNYQDANHKPEMVYSLTPYWALCGFRSPAEILALFDALHIPPSGLDSILQPLRNDATAPIEHVIHRLLTLEKEEAQVLLDTIHAALPHSGGSRQHLVGRSTQDICYWWVRELMRQFPGDVGALAPLYLNVVYLAPNEVLYLDAGTLHAYLHGTALEIMANSNNVLRGGLTVKHIDVAELLKILNFTPSLPPTVQPTSLPTHTGDCTHFTVAAHEFALTAINLGATEAQIVRTEGPEVILALYGEAHITIDGEATTLTAGNSLFVYPHAKVLRASGTGKLFCATVPPAPAAPELAAQGAAAQVPEAAGSKETPTLRG